MKQSSKYLARKEKFSKIVAAKPPKPVHDHDYKVGNRGDRYGWSKSIELELGRYSPEEREWRRTVLERDGFACVFCRSKERLEADHIKPKALYPELRFSLENGRTLCHKCHVKTETYGRKVHRIVAVEVIHGKKGKA